MAYVRKGHDDRRRGRIGQGMVGTKTHTHLPLRLRLCVFARGHRCKERQFARAIVFGSRPSHASIMFAIGADKTSKKLEGHVRENR